jgi:acyl-CoA synthetase (AMP-forming)/AMP-acid ligase II
MFDGLTVAHVLQHYGAVTYLADKPAIIFEDGATTRVLSWRDLNMQSSRIANVVLAAVGRRRHVGILLHNSPEFLEALFGIAKADGVSVIINGRLTGRELEYCLNKADVDFLITSEAFRGELEDIANGPSRLKPENIQFVDSKDQPHWLAGVSGQDPDLSVDPDARSVILFTSGTTGSPKAAIYTHRRIIHAWECFSRELATTRHDRVLIGAPLYAGLGVNFAAGTLFIGGSIVLVPRFDPALILTAIERHRVTMTPMAPTMFHILHEAASAMAVDTMSMRTCLSLGSALSASIRKKVHEVFPAGEIYEMYGSTETGCAVILHPEDQARKIVHNGREIGSVGQAVMGVSIRLLDDNGDEVPRGSVGEIYKRNLLGASEYYKNPELTASIYRGEWLTSNDLGLVDEDGHLYVVGRKKDMIVSGGLNVYASEVEEILGRLPDLGLFAVIGLPDEKWGEAVTAVIQGSGGRYSQDELREHCRASLADYKRPRRYCFVDALPLTASGKIEKYKLVQMLIAAEAQTSHSQGAASIHASQSFNLKAG